MKDNISEAKVLLELDQKISKQSVSWGAECMAPTRVFIIQRSKQWAGVLNIPYYEIIDKWLAKCNYSMVNYFQDCNQPELDENTRIFETLDDFSKSTGGDGFRCPHCGEMSTDFTDCTSTLKVNGKLCDWKSYGFFGCLGKGVFIFIKETFAYATIFMPIAWEANK